MTTFEVTLVSGPTRELFVMTDDDSRGAVAQAFKLFERLFGAEKASSAVVTNVRVLGIANPVVGA